MYNHKNTMSNPNPADGILNSFGIQSDGPAAFSNPNRLISSKSKNPADEILMSLGLPISTEKGYVPTPRIPRSADPLGLDHGGGKSHRRKARKAAKKSKRSKRSKRSRKARKSAYY